MTGEKLAEYVKRLVDEAPPITDEQRQRIQALLRPSSIPEQPYAFPEIDGRRAA